MGSTLKYLFTSCSVVFLGYGVRDDYVVKLLDQNASEMNLFGPGPHFVVTNDEVILPQFLNRIRYVIKLHPDHRAALSVVDYILQSVPAGVIAVETKAVASEASLSGNPGAVPFGQTGYYISDFIPPGTWETSQDITATGTGGDINVTVGLASRTMKCHLADQPPFTI